MQCGLTQTKFSNVKGKPSRYRLVGSTRSNSKKIKCNPDPINPTSGMTLDCHTVPLSNWSIALEIERLIRIETIKDWEPEYQFHKEVCVDCTTDLSSYEPDQVASMILEVNDNATNFFIQQIRRRLSILERPLTTARGDGKSYIYSNFNPKYAQMH
ncbi:hypothetical protein ABE29_20920 [Cytobacillus firmus]|nr:hypothetical protein [Cytobacillus firmus]MBG9554104.1 hypothetical protein [Cytobacillus firmus]MBG9559473.1 hypothetical protein [Cytobacillus firmus]MBG9576309.1 hypothetical protein [Cytobacillus firmus]